jgi:hypothetical protein
LGVIVNGATPAANYFSIWGYNTMQSSLIWHASCILKNGAHPSQCSLQLSCRSHCSVLWGSPSQMVQCVTTSGMHGHGPTLHLHRFEVHFLVKCYSMCDSFPGG